MATLGRTNLHPLLKRLEVDYPQPSSAPMKILVTGAVGSVGSALIPVLKDLGHDVRPWDTKLHPMMDVTTAFAADADVVYHLAADKHAPAGEEHPYSTQRVNIEGTRRVLNCGAPRVILASTCKAVMPETVYGASKLVAERMVLNEGGTVGRLYNVVESSRNVFEIWDEEYAATGMISATPCRRYFITMRECVGFLASLLDEQGGRFVPDPGVPIAMQTMAMRWIKLRGGTSRNIIDRLPRRGDRRVEPLVGEHEHLEATSRVYKRVVSAHDAAVSALEVAA